MTERVLIDRLHFASAVELQSLRETVVWARRVDRAQRAPTVGQSGPRCSASFRRVPSQDMPGEAFSSSYSGTTNHLVRVPPRTPC
ncbi:hypothetical protein QJS66_02245 [Kocuria rhizophila]|nr:hypothetical protein QJS66_02245 [Kocuria rhizophila]